VAGRPHWDSKLEPRRSPMVPGSSLDFTEHAGYPETYPQTSPGVFTSCLIAGILSCIDRSEGDRLP
jgi:hypothetical protein